MLNWIYGVKVAPAGGPADVMSLSPDVILDDYDEGRQSRWQAAERMLCLPAAGQGPVWVVPDSDEAVAWMTSRLATDLSAHLPSVLTAALGEGANAARKIAIALDRQQVNTGDVTKAGWWQIMNFYYPYTRPRIRYQAFTGGAGPFRRLDSWQLAKRQLLVKIRSEEGVEFWSARADAIITR